MADRIKVGLLTHAGGAHVKAYLQGLAATDECSEVVLADPDQHFQAEAQQLLGKKLGRTYLDYRALLSAERPEMVLVSMEAKLAPPVISAALDAGCHVFAEKPSCVRAGDFAPLVAKADRQHRYLMLALANRLNPEVVAARELIEEGQIGKLFGLEMHLIADQTRLTRPGYVDKWVAHKDRAGGGHLIWLGIHWLDLAMQLSGANIDHVVGFTANVGGQPFDVEDSAAAALKFDNGMLGTITSGYFLDSGYHSHIKLWGSEGWVHVESMVDEPLHWYTTKGSLAGKVNTWEGSKSPRGYTPFVTAAVRACAHMTDPPISSAHSLRAIKTVFAIYEAAESAKEVSVAP